jgi:hypothetical protein
MAGLGRRLKHLMSVKTLMFRDIFENDRGRIRDNAQHEKCVGILLLQVWCSQILKFSNEFSR